MIKKIVFGGIVIVVFFIVDHFMGNRMNKTYSDRFNDFNKSNLKSIIVDFSKNRRDVELILANDTVAFFPRTSDLNHNSIFGFTADKGDSIIKKPFNDTLILKKPNGTVFKFTFIKPNK